MIKRQDLLDAIAECQGERNPNANTCIKLAAYYTILNNSQPETEQYSRSSGGYHSGTEFSEAVEGLEVDVVYGIIDELMETLEVLSPKLYNATMEKIRRRF